MAEAKGKSATRAPRPRVVLRTPASAQAHSKVQERILTSPLISQIKLVWGDDEERQVWSSTEHNISSRLAWTKPYSQKDSFGWCRIVESNQDLLREFGSGTREALGDFLFLSATVSAGNGPVHLVFGNPARPLVVAFNVPALLLESSGFSKNKLDKLPHLLDIVTDPNVVKIIPDHRSVQAIKEMLPEGVTIEQSYHLNDLWYPVTTLLPLPPPLRRYNSFEACRLFRKRDCEPFHPEQAPRLPKPHEPAYDEMAARHPSMLNLERPGPVLRNFLFSQNMSGALAIIWCLRA